MSASRVHVAIVPVLKLRIAPIRAQSGLPGFGEIHHNPVYRKYPTPRFFDMPTPSRTAMTYASMVAYPFWCFACIAAVQAQPASSTRPAPQPATLSRVFYQDDETRTVKWANVLDGVTPKLGAVGTVAGFPQLDPEKQRLVQMAVARGKILVSVRDIDDGAFQSGWILIDTGIDEEAHGDHFHWYYRREPKVLAAVLDDKQGNPTHVYRYGDVFYVAHDRLNGYTRLDPAAIGANHDDVAIKALAGFHQGGGGHITLAVTEQRIGYATWIDREGENSGRVDITAIRPAGNAQVGTTLRLPHGSLHGAAANQGKVFFAPADGICWISAGRSATVDPQSIAAHHISLGKVPGDEETPVRAGHLEVFEKYVVFTTGEGSHAALNLIDASAAAPKVTRIPVPMADENKPAGVAMVRPRRGSPVAFVFHDHAADEPAPNLLSLIELDPNSDGNFADARIAKQFEVGSSKVVGHGGHHSLDFDADRRRGVFSNPGDGTLTIFLVNERKQAAVYRVGGAPSKVIMVGGRVSSH